MKKQNAIGVHVSYIFTNNTHVNTDWLNEDYLIINDKMLIQQLIHSTTKKLYVFDVSTTDQQLITIDPEQVKQKILRFSRLKDNETKF
jgi:hypothetical protein